ncbi:MAG: FkbM family methyltransferase [Acidobacteria bacterium]|nr:FkbM family methyltransferase [Acidobacteriota bacterium]
MTERDETKQDFERALQRLRQLPDAARARVQGRFSQALLDETFEIETPRGPLTFVILGRGSSIRAMSALRKQPATIEWIDSFSPGSVFWDVGANVGVYALYAARRGDTTVVAFEPAAVNFFLLAANCEANGLDAQVDCLLIGLGSEKSIGHMAVSQFVPAESFRFRGTSTTKHPTQQAALMLSMDQLVEEYGAACPNYIKIDVPALTEAIIIGGARLLGRPEVRELHIEMREDSATGRRIAGILDRAGFEVVGRPTRGGSTDLIFARRGSSARAIA